MPKESRAGSSSGKEKDKSRSPLYVPTTASDAGSHFTEEPPEHAEPYKPCGLVLAFNAALEKQRLYAQTYDHTTDRGKTRASIAKTALDVDKHVAVVPGWPDAREDVSFDTFIWKCRDALELRAKITKAEATRKQEEAGEHKEWATYYARKAKREAQWLKNKASAKAKRIKAKSKASEQQRKEKRAQREKERKEREKQEKKARSPPPSDKVAGDGAAPKKPWYRFW